MNDQISVVLLVGDRVVEATDDQLVVRTTAALIAGARRDREPAALAPITAGKRTACRLIAVGIA